MQGKSNPKENSKEAARLGLPNGTFADYFMACLSRIMSDLGGCHPMM